MILLVEEMLMGGDLLFFGLGRKKVTLAFRCGEVGPNFGVGLVLQTGERRGEYILMSLRLTHTFWEDSTALLRFLGLGCFHRI